jgi:hypothetical protein
LAPAAVACLRARENTGQPYLAEESFIAAQLERYPDWADEPGATSSARLIELAQVMGLAESGQEVAGWDQLRARHERGEIVLLLLTSAKAGVQAQRFALVTAADEHAVKAWAPTSDGYADDITLSRREIETPGRARVIALQPA